jgi:hypothetical protein
MTLSSSPSVSFEKLINMVHHAQESLTLLNTLEQAVGDNAKCPPSTSILAAQVIRDLYNQTSSDEANINRITTNLEAAANDLLMISKLIRSLKR